MRSSDRKCPVVCSNIKLWCNRATIKIEAVYGTLPRLIDITSRGVLGGEYELPNDWTTMAKVVRETARKIL